MKQWTIVIQRDTNGLCAYVAEFPGCFATGSSLTELLANVDAAMEDWIQGALESGISVPTLSDEIQDDYRSGKTATDLGY